MDEQLLVSVLITSYNREKYIADAIESVLNSTFKNFELIIVDDESTDASFEIAVAFANKDSRIRVYRNSINLGQFSNRNKAASYAKGKYIKYLDSDDTIKPWGLAYCVDLMEKFPNAALGVAYYGNDFKTPLLLYPKDAVTIHFKGTSILSIGPSGVIIRTKDFIQHNGFDSRFGVASDLYFNLKIASKLPVLLIQNDFFYYREHPGQEKNNTLGYLIHGYNSLKELLEKSVIPLNEKDLKFQRRKLDKRFSVNIVKYLIKRPSIIIAKEIFNKTGHNFLSFFLGFFK